MATCTTLKDDFFDFGKWNLLRWRIVIRFRRGGIGNCKKQDEGNWQQDKTLLRPTLVLHIEVMPDQNADQCNARKQRPTVGIPICHGIMVADHNEEDRQRKIVVVK